MDQVPPPPDYAIVQTHNGTASASHHTVPHFEEWSPPAVGQGRTIVLVDDEPAVRDIYASILRAAFACNVIVHSDPEKALHEVRTLAKISPNKVVLVTDEKMDGHTMDGWQIIDALKRDHVPAEAILFTGDEALLLNAHSFGMRGAYKGVSLRTEENQDRRTQCLYGFVTAVHHALASQYAHESKKPLPEEIARAEKLRSDALREKLAEDKQLQEKQITRHQNHPWIGQPVNGVKLPFYHPYDGDYLAELKENAARRDREDAAKGDTTIATARADVSLQMPDAKTASSGANAEPLIVNGNGKSETSWRARRSKKPATQHDSAKTF
jgi:DNA-binding NarL/FixJ family response regulator